MENGGEIVSTDAHAGSSGRKRSEHVYRVTLDAPPKSPVLVVQCKTDGRKNSEGDLVLKKVDP